MDQKTRSIFSDLQIDRMKAFLRDAQDASNVLCGASQMGLDAPDVEVLASDILWSNPNQRFMAARLYVTIDPHTGLLGSKSKAITMDEELEYERLVTLSGLNVLDVTDCTTLSPADAAIELNEEDVRHLERAHPLFGDWVHYLRDFLDALTGDGLKFPWPGVHSGSNSEHHSTFYMVGNEVNELMAIRPDGTVLPVGRSMSDPDEELDGEREEMVRPRVEDLRE